MSVFARGCVWFRFTLDRRRPAFLHGRTRRSVVDQRRLLLHQEVGLVQRPREDQFLAVGTVLEAFDPPEFIDLVFFLLSVHLQFLGNVDEIPVVALEIADQPVEGDEGVLLPVVALFDLHLAVRDAAFSVLGFRLVRRDVPLVVGDILEAFEAEHQPAHVACDILRRELAVRTGHIAAVLAVALRHFHFEGVAPNVEGDLAQVDDLAGQFDDRGRFGSCAERTVVGRVEFEVEEFAQVDRLHGNDRGIGRDQAVVRIGVDGHLEGAVVVDLDRHGMPVVLGRGIPGSSPLRRRGVPRQRGRGGRQRVFSG